MPTDALKWTLALPPIAAISSLFGRSITNETRRGFPRRVLDANADTPRSRPGPDYSSGGQKKTPGRDRVRCKTARAR
jgi:hypothetical protein